MTSLDEAIDKKIGEVRTDALDISFGELVSLYSSKEFIIQPDYQRLFRWSDEQKSRLIESTLLELPIPPIFVMENVDGVLELIDGLQRISSIIQFIDPSLISKDPLELQGCDLVEELNGNTYENLSLSLKLRLKRSSVRTVLIKRQSKSFLRYEMFKRLNTGGSGLEPQEIRNCSARMLGENGIQFYAFLKEKASYAPFKNCIETLAEVDKEKKGDEELVLRFFAAKNGLRLFKGNVRDWLDSYMESILLEKIHFDYEVEEDAFNSLFDYLNQVIGAGAFVKYRGTSPVGGLAPAYYEAVAVGTSKVLNEIYTVSHDEVKQQIIKTLQDENFRKFTGSGANRLEKLKGRIDTISNALLGLI